MLLECIEHCVWRLWLNTINPDNNPMSKVLSLFILICGYWGTEKLSDLPKVTKLGNTSLNPQNLLPEMFVCCRILLHCLISWTQETPPTSASKVAGTAGACSHAQLPFAPHSKNERRKGWKRKKQPLPLSLIKKHQLCCSFHFYSHLH
jgi:hypothetical protein